MKISPRIIFSFISCLICFIASPSLADVATTAEKNAVIEQSPEAPSVDEREAAKTALQERRSFDDARGQLETPRENTSGKIPLLRDDEKSHRHGTTHMTRKRVATEQNH